MHPQIDLLPTRNSYNRLRARYQSRLACISRGLGHSLPFPQVVATDGLGEGDNAKGLHPCEAALVIPWSWALGLTGETLRPCPSSQVSAKRKGAAGSQPSSIRGYVSSPPDRARLGGRENERGWRPLSGKTKAARQASAALAKRTRRQAVWWGWGWFTVRARKREPSPARRTGPGPLSSHLTTRSSDTCTVTAHGHASPRWLSKSPRYLVSAIFFHLDDLEMAFVVRVPEPGQGAPENTARVHIEMTKDAGTPTAPGLHHRRCSRESWRMARCELRCDSCRSGCVCGRRGGQTPPHPGSPEPESPSRSQVSRGRNRLGRRMIRANPLKAHSKVAQSL